jgi:nucleoside-diphosphate-sugar epimerase
LDQPGTTRIGSDPGGRCALVTGATGLLGSHLAEQLRAQGEEVRALVRTRSETRFLESLGVEIVRGDLIDPAACARAVAGVHSVFHCAAKVGDWGRWGEFQTGCLDATETLARAALRARVGRFVHVSSTSAYGHPRPRTAPIDETAPLGENVWILDYYTRSKVLCELLLWKMAEQEGLPLTVIRPSWLFGERDRTTAPRLIYEFRRGRMMIVGNGKNPLSAVYAGVVADAAIKAARDPGSVGEAYNITSQGKISQREFLDLFAGALGVPRVKRRVPYGLAFAGGFLLEVRDRLLMRKRPPRVTRYGAWLLGRQLEYSTEKARTRLGWQPAIGYEESIERTLRWFLREEAGAQRADQKGTLERPGAFAGGTPG